MSSSYQHSAAEPVLAHSSEQEPLVNVDEQSSSVLVAPRSFMTRFGEWTASKPLQAFSVALGMLVLTVLGLLAVSLHAPESAHPMASFSTALVDMSKLRVVDRAPVSVLHRAPKLDAEGAGWQMIWSDEFNGFDGGKWNKFAGVIPGNWDSQMYTPDNVYVENGALVIVAKKEQNGDRLYTSGRVDTLGKFNFQYGRIEASVQLPYGQGIWPAVWLLPVDGSCWPNHGEMDVVEGHNYHAFGTMTWGPCGLRAGCTFQAPDIADFSQGFHQFAIEWTPSSTSYFVDGNRYGGTAPDNCFVPTASPFYIIANTAVGGDWSGYPDGSTPFPNFLRIDYIRVYQWRF